MTPPPRHFRPRACLLATALLALSPGPLAAAPVAPGDLLSAAPYRASWVPSKAAQAYKLHYRTPDHRGRLAEGTGLLYLPAGAAPAGGWPVVS